MMQAVITHDTGKHNSAASASALCRVAATCVILALAPMRLAAEGIAPERLAHEERKVEEQRIRISTEVMKASERARRKRQEALVEAQKDLAPVGLLIASPPTPAGGQLYTIQAEEVKFGSVLICLARKARFDLVIDPGVGSKLLDEPVTADLRLVALDDALEVLSGMVGLLYRTGQEKDGLMQVLIFSDDLASGEELADSLRRNAVGIYTRLLLRYPEDDLALDAYFRIAEIHFDQEEYALAAQDYKLLLSSDSTWKFAPRALVKLGRCYSMLGDYPSASKALYDFLDHAPEPAAVPEALLALAGAAARADDIPEAFRAYRKLLLEHPSAKESTQALHELGDLLFDQEEYQSAQRQYELLRKRRPKYEGRTIRYRIAMCKMLQKHWGVASADFVKLLSAGKQDAIAGECYHGLAKCLDNSGGKLEALEAYIGAVEKFPCSPGAPKARARVIELYRQLGLLDKAIAYGEGSLKLIPPGSASERVVKYQLAAAFFDAKDYGRAMVFFEDVAQAGGEIHQTDALIHAGDAACELRKFQRAEVLYRGALKAGPDNAQHQRAFLGLGDSYFAQGKYEKAALAYQGMDLSEKKR